MSAGRTKRTAAGGEAWVPDSVDGLIASWNQRRPDLDFAPVAIVSRLERVRGHIDRELEEMFRSLGLSGPDFAVLVTLARIGEEGSVTQRRLANELGLTSGTVSVRIDRLAEAGLVERQADPKSKRNARIELTRAGRELFERAVPAHLANEDRLLSALDQNEREELANLLRKLLVEFEGAVEPAQPLGLTVAPAHVTIALRHAMGLEPWAGLLVREVEVDSPAAEAGIRAGDVLAEADGLQLNSIGPLLRALDAAEEQLKIRFWRGEKLRTGTLQVPRRWPKGQRPSTSGRLARQEHRL